MVRLALSKAEAAEALGLSTDSFERHVQDELRCVYVGRRRLYPVGELQRWLERQAVRPAAVRETGGGRRDRMDRGAA
jgi:hypothetical protein